MSDAIQVRDIVKKFGDFTAVDHISFTVKAGEIVGLLGPNGAGKSTLIRMMVTLLTPTSGTVLINGFDVVRQSDDVRRSIGVIPQSMTSDLELSVEENLLIFAKLYGVSRDKRTRLIRELLEAVELTQWADKPVKNLSGGMRRRVEIARGLVHEPRIFFLDEPTTGLDPVSRTAVWTMLQKIKSQRDLTVLITTHYMEEAERLSDHLVVLQAGKVRATGASRAVLGDVVGEHIVVVPQTDGGERLVAWLDERNASRSPVLGHWHIPFDAAGLAAFVAAFPDLRYEIRRPTLDDLFLSLSGERP